VFPRQETSGIISSNYSWYITCCLSNLSQYGASISYTNVWPWKRRCRACLYWEIINEEILHTD